MRAAIARVDAPSNPLAPNSTSADSSSAARISVLVRRTRTLVVVGDLRGMPSSVPLLSTDNKAREGRGHEHHPRYHESRSRFGASAAAVEGSVPGADRSRHAALGAPGICSYPPDLRVRLRPPIRWPGDVDRLL